jgi:histidinol-phosphatase (PHP family)
MDNHVHSEWSYDTGPAASMRRACLRALELGLPALAFTEHVDFTIWGEGDSVRESGVVLDYPAYTAPLDVQGYESSIARCREEFPQLQILSGVEAGEAHLFAGSLARVLSDGQFDRVLGSVHALPHDGALVQVETLYPILGAEALMRRYLTEVHALVEGSDAFEVLAHLDYARRHWPSSAGAYDERRFQEEYRRIMRALAETGRVLEVNTLSPLASVQLVRWWYEMGGERVSFGSDAHVPTRVGDRFDLAVDVVEAAGFRSGRHPLDFWRR